MQIKINLSSTEVFNIVANYFKDEHYLRPKDIEVRTCDGFKGMLVIMNGAPKSSAKESSVFPTFDGIEKED